MHDSLIFGDLAAGLYCKTRLNIEQMFGIWKRQIPLYLYIWRLYDVSTERCVVVIVATAILHNICIDRKLPAPEVDDAASDSDSVQGDGEGDIIVNRITATTA